MTTEKGMLRRTRELLAETKPRRPCARCKARPRGGTTSYCLECQRDWMRLRRAFDGNLATGLESLAAGVGAAVAKALDLAYRRGYAEGLAKAEAEEPEP